MCGASAYPRDWDYALIRAVANSVDAWVMGDIAHLGGFIAANELNDPFQYCDIVTATTHKSLRGPRGGLIFFRKNHPKALDLEKRINEAVSPICQNGPHNSVSVNLEIIDTGNSFFSVSYRPLLQSLLHSSKSVNLNGKRMQNKYFATLKFSRRPL